MAGVEGSGKLSFFLPVYYSIFYICRYTVVPVLPLLVEEWGLLHEQAGLALSSLYTGYAIALLLSGFLITRVGSRVAVVAGASGSIASNLALLLARDPSRLSLVLLANGLSQGVVWPSLMQIVASSYPGRRASYVVGSLLTAAILGPSLTLSLASLVMQVCDWTLLFPLSAAMLGAATCIFLTLDVERGREGAALSTTSLRDLRVWLLGVAYACFYALERGVLGWLPLILVEEAGLAPPAASMVSGAIPVLSALAAFAGMLVSDKLGVREAVLMSTSFTVSAALLTAATLGAPIPETVTALLVSLGFSEWFYFTLLPRTLPAEEVGAASGLIDALGYAGSSLGSWLLGLTRAVCGDYRCFPLTAIPIALAGAATSLATLRISVKGSQR